MPCRCCFNAAVTFLAGFPDIEQGLQSVFVAAGQNLTGTTYATSLARIVCEAVSHIHSQAMTDSIGDLGSFVKKLTTVKDVKNLVQWQGRPGYEQLRLNVNFSARSSTLSIHADGEVLQQTLMLMQDHPCAAGS